MYNIGDTITCDPGYGGVILMKVQAGNSFEYLIELPCKLYFRVREENVRKA